MVDNQFGIDFARLCLCIMFQITPSTTTHSQRLHNPLTACLDWSTIKRKRIHEHVKSKLAARAALKMQWLRAGKHVGQSFYDSTRKKTWCNLKWKYEAAMAVPQHGYFTGRWLPTGAVTSESWFSWRNFSFHQTPQDTPNSFQQRASLQQSTN